MAGWDDLFDDLKRRFDDVREESTRSGWLSDDAEPPRLWTMLARRGSVRRFQPAPPAPAELRTLAALALASPTKSDLQQRDIVLVTEEPQLSKLKALLADQAWTAGAPVLVVFCANNRRQRLLHRMRGHAFANDHLDAFFNASVDAAIALATFVLAAEAAGFGACPISAIRNKPDEASAILGLPDHVFPIAGLAVGRPAEQPTTSLRLPLSLTVHDNRFSDSDPIPTINHYDERRARLQPYAQQRHADRLGHAQGYCWSEDKARQYSQPERSDFGAFIRRKGFSTD
jgi:nitroreductase